MKDLKSTENISAYKDILARIEVKLFCKEEALQLQLRDTEVKNLIQNKDGSIISTELENHNYKKTLQQLQGVQPPGKTGKNVFLKKVGGKTGRKIINFKLGVEKLEMLDILSKLSFQ